MLPMVDQQGRIHAAPGQMPAFHSAGIGYTPSGQMCTWPTPNADDRFIAGLRVRNNGQVIVADGVAGNRPYVFNGGLPQSRLDGSLIRQTDVAPAQSDPYVRGIRVGPRGGVYFTTDLVDALSVPAPMAFDPPEEDFGVNIHE